MQYKIWTVPNIISFLRICSIFPLCYFIINHQDLYVLLLVIISGLSDWLDGAVARKYNQISKLGQALDPVADRLYILCLIIFLCLQNKLPLWIFLVLLIRELFVAFLQVYFAKFNVGPVRVSVLGKVSTALLLYSLPIVYLSNIIDTNDNFIWSLGWAAVIWALILHLLAGGHYFYIVYKYYLQISKKNSVK
ncbi:MAG: CDP-alcohol phosphatidyltransferase family protein [Bifidobacteriaceae bacterium]|jgi:cardiolipin synthase|nr:CDP-alcohol phosphatidyltransferase family protein [Bifidobacteriaceae bacterium]